MIECVIKCKLSSEVTLFRLDVRSFPCPQERLTFESPTLCKSWTCLYNSSLSLTSPASRKSQATPSAHRPIHNMTDLPCRRRICDKVEGSRGSFELRIVDIVSDTLAKASFLGLEYQLSYQDMDDRFTKAVKHQLRRIQYPTRECLY